MNRITPKDIDEVIVDAAYYVFPGTTLTVCCLTLKNGYQVIGESACADPENFDAEVGRHYATENAKNNIWSLEGYLLKQRMHENEISQD